MSGIYAGWRRDGLIAGHLAGVALAISGRPEGPLTEGGGGVAACVEAGRQELYRRGSVLLACEADLYNLAELAQSVGMQGAGTAECLAELYAQYGSDFAARLDGRFAVVLWDARKRQLVAAVDSFGAGRLVYYRDARMVLIGSRVDALAACPEVDRTVNPRAIVNLLNFSINPGPATIFSRVERLLPGHVLVAGEGELRPKQYWDMRYGETGETGEERLAEELYAVVEKAVAATCRGWDGERTGTFLSGGTDSSTVLGMMHRVGPERPKAFSIGFREQPFNEMEYAEIAAKRFHARHFTYFVGPDDCFRALPAMLQRFDEPFGNSSAIPTYFCARLARENGVEMLLAGDGGDELFGGNERYATDRIYESYHRLPGALRKGLIEPFLKLLPFQAGLFGRARRYVARANLPAMERFLSFQFLFVCPAEEVFEDGFREALGAYSILEVPSAYYSQAPAQDHLDRLLYADVKITLGDNDLPKVTRMCDACGIAPRFPFLDRAVAEFSGRIPANLKVKGFEKRYLFKKAFAGLLPEEIIRKKKHGFGIPVAEWLKTDRRYRELARDTLGSARAQQRGYFRRGFIDELFRRHEADDSTFYGDTLWTVLMLELWHRQVVDAAAGVAV